MQKIILYIYFISFSTVCLAQTTRLDSLKLIISKSNGDTSKVNNLLELSKAYLSSSPADAIRYSNEAKELSVKIKYRPGVAYALKNIGMVYYNQTKYVETIEHWTQS